MIKLRSERDNSLTFFEQVLRNRGMDCTEEQFFNLDWSCVNSPYNLDYIEAAADLYIKHITLNSKIAVLIDVDMDGYSSAALLMNYTNKQLKYGSWVNSTPELIPVFHDSKIHGLNDKEMMCRVRDEIKPNLFVIPDASGNEAQYKALTDLGIDIIVLDHHDMKERGNGENVIVVNNQQSERYSNKNLSGVGIVWQFCRVLDDKCVLMAANDYLDLVALGNVGDVMDLRSDETRFLCWQGMKNENINSQLISYLQVTAYSMKEKPYGPITISFNIAPLFNAICRIGDMKEKEFLFKCLLDGAMEEMVPSGKRGHTNEMVSALEEGVRLATNAKSRQDSRKNKLADMIDKVIEEEGLLENHVLVLAFDDFKDDYRALSGLVAAKLADTYRRPVILAFRTEEDAYVGSLRAPDNIPAYLNFKDQCEATGCCTFVAGHQQAAGIGIKVDKVSDLNDIFNIKYAELDTQVLEEVDFIFDAEDPELVDYIEQMAEYSSVWGQNIEEPKIAIKNVPIAAHNTSLLGARKNTLKITHKNFNLINFHSGQVEYDSLKLDYNDKVEQYYSATVVCSEASINEFRGGHIPQMNFKTYELGDVKYQF